MNRTSFYRITLIAMGWLAIGLAAAWSKPPSTLALQGLLTGPDGLPLNGARVWRVQFYDASTGGNPLGSIQGGTVGVSRSGQWSISLSSMTTSTGQQSWC